MDDFEELKEGESVVVHLIAGATAGVAEHCGMFPVDTVKTSLQAFRPTGGSETSAIRTAQIMINRHGFLGLFRGITAVAAGAAPAHAMHFATYEFCKNLFGANQQSHNPIPAGLAGICATVVSDAILTPMDAVKQRLQLRVREYKGVVDCLQSVIRTHGVRSLYASYTTTLMMNVPYHAVYFASYESLRKFLKRGSEKEYDVLAHCIGGGIAGMTAAAITNPFDVAKTRLQTQGEMMSVTKYSGMINTITTIWKEEGRAGLLHGIRPRIALHSTSAAICWVTYEYMKYLLNQVVT